MATKDQALAPKRDEMRWLKRAAIAIGTVSLAATALPALGVVAGFFALMTPFVLPFLFYEGAHELEEAHAHRH